MTTSHITQCPHCRTAFRVSDEQLGVAKGAVRCGSCLKVFRADEHFRDNTPIPPMRATEEPIAKPAPEAAPAQPIAQRSRTTSAATQAVDSLPKDPAWDVGSEFDADDDDFLFSEDDPSADDGDLIFMDDDQDLDDELDAGDSDLEFSDSFLALDDSAASEEDSAKGQKSARAVGRPEQLDADEDAWSRDLLAETAAVESTPAKRSTPKAIKPLDDLSFSLDTPEDNLDSTPDKPAPASNQRSMFAHHDLDEMVERMEQPRSATGLWTLAAVFMLIVFAGQILWWQRAQLAQNASLSPVYVQLCQYVACDLAEPVPDATALRPISSVLREMPNQRMRLDAVLINRGARPLPFPNVLLAITDAQGDVVADGLFSPADYISGDFRPEDLVPPGQPISISINTNRPVDNLDNFRLSFQY